MPRLALQLNFLVRFAFVAILSLMLGPGELGHVRSLIGASVSQAHATGDLQPGRSLASDRTVWRLKAAEGRRADRGGTDERDGPGPSLDTAGATARTPALSLGHQTGQSRRVGVPARLGAASNQPRAPPIVA